MNDDISEAIRECQKDGKNALRPDELERLQQAVDIAHSEKVAHEDPDLHRKMSNFIIQMAPVILARIERAEGLIEVQLSVLTDYKEQACRAERRLLNLLARIHRDGGQYTRQHGLGKSQADADTVIAGVFAERDSLKAEAERLKKTIATMLDTDEEEITVLRKRVEELEGLLKAERLHSQDRRPF